MASFDEKVEALRRLQEKRQARLSSQKESEKEPCVAAAAAGELVPKSLVVEKKATTASKEVEGRELTDVLERYARIQGQSKSSPQHEADESAPPGAGYQANESAAPGAPTGGHGLGDTGDEADALYCLGHCLENGMHDCEQDDSRAAVYYRMAAEKGSIVGQWRLGHLHEYGKGVESSDEWAAHWYRLAAQSGHAQAQTSLALLLEDGRIGGARDDDEALRWHLAAAAQNQALSQYCAACCLAEGRGAPKDMETSKMLLTKSAASGFPLAVEALAGGKLWNHADLQEEDPEDSGEETSEGVSNQSLLDIAARVAKQIGHLDDAEADAFLEELMGSLDVDDPSVLGDEDIIQLLAGRQMPAALTAQCAVAA